MGAAGGARDVLCAQGYIWLRAGIEPVELAALRAAADGLISKARAAASPASADYLRCADHEPLNRIEYLFDKHPAFLSLAAHPLLLAMAAETLGAEPIVTWEDMFLKQLGSSLKVPFHQDSLYQCRRSAVYRFGVYLDDSSSSPLTVLPGSHQLGALHASQIQALIEAHREELAPLVAVGGDVLMHDALLIHGSELHPAAPMRRVVYLEYRTEDQRPHVNRLITKFVVRIRQAHGHMLRVRPQLLHEHGDDRRVDAAGQFHGARALGEPVGDVRPDGLAQLRELARLRSDAMHGDLVPPNPAVGTLSGIAFASYRQPRVVPGCAGKLAV